MARHPATDDTVLPKMLPLDSGTVDSAGYLDERNSLYVRFIESDAVYVYHLVPRAVFKEFLASASKGAFLNRRVKPRYPATKLEGA